MEDAYEAAIVKPAVGMAFLAKAFDGFLDGLARLISAIPRFIGPMDPADSEWARSVLRPVDGAGIGRADFVHRVPDHSLMPQVF